MTAVVRAETFAEFAQEWALLGAVVWLAVAVVAGLAIGRVIRGRDEQKPRDPDEDEPGEPDDLARVWADDELLDLIVAGQIPGDDEIAVVLAAWKAEVEQ